MKDADLLTFTAEQLTRSQGSAPDQHAFPDQWHVADLVLPVTYRFEPGTVSDGVAVTVDLAVLNRLDAATFTWQVPGLRAELVQAMIRALPKALRRSFVPAPDFAAAVLDRLGTPTRSLREAVATALTSFGGPVVEAADIDMSKVPAFLQVLVRVVDDRGRVVGEDRDLARLQRSLAPRTRAAVADAAPSIEQERLASWPLPSIPPRVDVERPGGRVTGYPSLVEAGDSVSLRVLATVEEQRHSMPRGLRRLLMVELGSPVRAVVRRLDGRTKLALAHNPYGSVPALLQDAVAATIDDLISRRGALPWDETGYARLRAAVQRDLPHECLQVVTAVGQVLAVAHEVTLRTSALQEDSAVRDDLEVQMQGLVHDGFVSQVGRARLPDVERYLRGMLRRLDVLPSDPVKDARRMAQVHEVEDAYLDVVEGMAPARRGDPAVVDIRWMLEELRVSVFAQQLGTPRPVSAKRVRTALAALRT